MSTIVKPLTDSGKSIIFDVCSKLLAVLNDCSARAYSCNANVSFITLKKPHIQQAVIEAF